MAEPVELAEPVGILLAGGVGSRFGADKLLHPLADGTPMAGASLRHLQSALARVVAVVRPDADALAQLLRAAGAEVTVCANAAEGMGATLAHAVRHAGAAAGYVVALADMPLIRPATIGVIASRVRAGARLAAPSFRGERGHPVGFAASFRAELEALAGDAGAREVLKRHAAELTLLPVDDPGVLQDIDTPDDLRL